jgi:prepilin-type processing-associated H-X9-DG protein
LLVAIAVIAILLSMLFPAVNRALESARRIRGANCLRQIALAYGQYCNADGKGGTIIAASKTEWINALAQKGYINDPNIYCFPGDSGATAMTSGWKIGDALAADKTLSVELIGGIPSDAPLSTTPIAFTRGIPEATATGTKWPSDGVYGSKGGYIAFLDGHVEWYEDLGGNG